MEPTANILPGSRDEPLRRWQIIARAALFPGSDLVLLHRYHRCVTAAC
ncbi:hypothetical protein KCP71_23240 [Salmonella enterica subsp. enterica]|nr:hypothetical protein KCP71_23240 [Salmonella enterica subsp. enterica]